MVYHAPDSYLKSLVKECEVHRDLYLDKEVFSAEMERLFRNTWVLVGHAGQEKSHA